MWQEIRQPNKPNLTIPAPVKVVIVYRREEGQGLTFGIPAGQSEAGTQLPPHKGGKCYVCTALVAQWVKNLPTKTRVPSLEKIPWRRGWQLQYICWKIPWTEEAGRLESMGSWRVGPNQSDWTHMPYLTEDDNYVRTVCTLCKLYQWSSLHPIADLRAGTNLEFPNVGTGRIQQEQMLVKVYGYKLRTQRWLKVMFCFRPLWDSSYPAKSMTTNCQSLLISCSFLALNPLNPYS